MLCRRNRRSQKTDVLLIWKLPPGGAPEKGKFIFATSLDAFLERIAVFPTFQGVFLRSERPDSDSQFGTEVFRGGGGRAHGLFTGSTSNTHPNVVFLPFFRVARHK